MTRLRNTPDVEANDVLLDLPSKMMLILNAVDKGNQETHQLLRIIIDELRNNNKKQDEVSESIVTSIATTSNNIADALSNSLKEVESLKAKKAISLSEATKSKRKIDQLWKNSLNSRKQAFWQQYKAKNVAEKFSELLIMEPPQMLRKFLPKEIKNESEEETKIRKELAIEKVKTEIKLLQVRSSKYEQAFKNIDEKMILYFTNNYSNDICDAMITEWQNDCQHEEAFSISKFTETEEWFYNNTSSDFRNDQPNQNDKVHRSNYNTRRQNNQAPNGSKNTTHRKRNNRDRNFRNEEENTNKKDETWEQRKNEEYRSKFPTLADARKTEVRKQKPTLGKFTRISKQRKPIETVEIKTPERKTRHVSINESDEIQVVLETDTSNGDICRSGKSNDNFLFHGQGATNSAQTREQ